MACHVRKHMLDFEVLCGWSFVIFFFFSPQGQLMAEQKSCVRLMCRDSVSLLSCALSCQSSQELLWLRLKEPIHRKPDMSSMCCMRSSFFIRCPGHYCNRSYLAKSRFLCLELIWWESGNYLVLIERIDLNMTFEGPAKLFYLAFSGVMILTEMKSW